MNAKMREAVVSKREGIKTKYVPNGYKGFLSHKEIDVTDSLKIVVDVDQDMEVMSDEQGVLGTCRYFVRVQEKKNGVLRPYMGQNCTQLLTDRFKTSNTNVCFAVLSLSNMRDKVEPALYQIMLRVEIEEPVEATFTSVVSMVY